MSQAATQPAATPLAEDRRWWFDARGLDGANKRVLDAVEQSQCAAVLVGPDQLDAVRTAKQRVVWVEKPEQVGRLGKQDWVLSPDESLVLDLRRSGRKAGCFFEVPDLEKQFPRCIELVERGHDFVVIDMHHATYIPFELLVAKVKKLKEGQTRLLRRVPIRQLEGVVDDVNQSLNAFATLESGVDVLLGVHREDAIRQLEGQMRLCRPGRMQLVEAEVVEVQHTMMGDRVCIDTTSMMTPEEGMLIGSTGWGGLFVCSENHYLPHMNLREFRVNAGPVQSYVWGPDGKAVYLSELKAGSHVLAVDTQGRTRVLTVGRVKIERRPLLLIVAVAPLPAATNGKQSADQPAGQGKDAGRKQRPAALATIKTFVQNDWHVRIMGADRQVRNSSLIRKGDRLLAHSDWPGRHTGVAVQETIVEK